MSQNIVCNIILSIVTLLNAMQSIEWAVGKLKVILKYSNTLNPKSIRYKTIIIFENIMKKRWAVLLPILTSLVSIFVILFGVGINYLTLIICIIDVVIIFNLTFFSILFSRLRKIQNDVNNIEQLSEYLFVKSINGH
jgi:hypothetical protein